MPGQIQQTSTKNKNKRTRMFRVLKRLLCCCWCKAPQQDEEAEEYVVIDSPRQDEEETAHVVCEKNDSLVDSRTETAQSLQVTCGQSPACESDQSLGEECAAVEDPEREAGQSSSDGEYLSAPDLQTSSKEDCLCATEDEITSCLQAIEKKLREAEQRREARKMKVLHVEVAPDMRPHVVGPRGETLRRLAQEHPGVTVTLPPPRDTRTATVSIRGPREEAAVVAGCIRACVQAAGQRQRRVKGEQ